MDVAAQWVVARPGAEEEGVRGLALSGRFWRSVILFSPVPLSYLWCLSSGSPARLSRAQVAMTLFRIVGNRFKWTGMEALGLSFSGRPCQCLASQHLATESGSLGLRCRPSRLLGEFWKASTVVMSPKAVFRLINPLTEFCSFWLQVGLVYMFNLIVGTGALTMPKAFATAGWLVSLILLVFLGFMR